MSNDYQNVCLIVIPGIKLCNPLKMGVLMNKVAFLGYVCVLLALYNLFMKE